MFVNRTSELKAINSRLDSDNFEMVILYGRRRQGKTSLLYEAVKNKGAIFYTGSKNNNVEKFKRTAKLEHLVSEWDVLFRALKDRIIVLDEFPYILEEDPSIGADLQKVIDFDYKNSKTKLFLCGSIISVVKENLLEYNAPLYGRKTAQMKLGPIRFSDSQAFYKNASIEDLVKAYSFSGGVPQYAEMAKFPFENWFEGEITRPDSVLVDEIEFLVKSEFKKEKSYFSILEAISMGKNTFGEIKEHGKFKGTDITPYLDNLKYAEFIEVETPFFGLRKNSRYVIRDWFTKFWFNFVYPYDFEISTNQYRLGKGALNKYLGFVFEDIISQLFAEGKFNVFKQSRFARQWGSIPAKFSPKKGENQYEIDLVAINEGKMEILFCECKWQGKVNATAVAKELNEKAKYVGWNDDNRKEAFAIFAKSFSKKIDEFEGKKVTCLDLKDIGKILGK